MALKKTLIFVPPPVVYIAAFALGIGLDHWYPLAKVGWMNTPGVKILGWALFAVGFMVGPTSAIRFLIKKTTLKPFRESDVFVSDGFYRFTRNPMYLGLFLIYIGLSFVFASLWALVLIVIPLAFITLIVVPNEEKLLTQKFGQSYVDYCAKVSRWFGRS